MTKRKKLYSSVSNNSMFYYHLTKEQKNEHKMFFLFQLMTKIIFKIAALNISFKKNLVLSNKIS